MNIKEIYELSNHNAKTVMLYLRKEENINDFINETDYLPDTISKSERYYCWLNKLKEIPTCPICGKYRIFNKVNTGYFATCGDSSCKSALIAKSNSDTEKRDWNKIQEKMRNTYKAKTGYEHNMQNPEFKKQFFENYKETHNGELCGVQSKNAIINQRKYIEKKRINDNNELINRLHKMNLTFITFNSKLELSVKCNNCNNEFTLNRYNILHNYYHNVFNICPYCYTNKQHSNFELTILNEIKKLYNGIILTNDRKIFNNTEVDIIIPEYKLGIECNGLYWHSNKFRENNYHKNKKDIVESYGYTLIQLWEDDWANKLNIIINIIKQHLNLLTNISLTNNYIIKEISQKDSDLFLNENSLYDKINAKYRYGLFYNNELIQVLLLKKHKNNDFEILRFTTKLGYNILDGLRLLIEYFRTLNNIDNIYINVSCDIFNKNNKLLKDFEFIKYNAPIFWWSKGIIKESRLYFTKNKLIELGYDKNLSETEIMEKLGYYKIYNSGGMTLKYKVLDKISYNILYKENIFDITENTLNNEYNKCKLLNIVDLSTLKFNYYYCTNIIKYFQPTFFKYEKELYIKDIIKRRKIIENRCLYLNKKEDELTVNDILTGFKKSGIFFGYSHFNPGWTNWFINKFNIKSIFDPCGGWGHHLLGMLSCDKIIYNDINRDIYNGVKEMKEYFMIDNLELYNKDIRDFDLTEDVDAWFMCPPYYNLEDYGNDSFKDIEEYREFLNIIFGKWKDSNSGIFGMVIREDYYELLDDVFKGLCVDKCVLKVSKSHLVKKKKFGEYFYIFRK